MNQFEPSDALLYAMKDLAARFGLDRVEVRAEPPSVSYDRHSVLFIPGLGWTVKNDVTAGPSGWAAARVVKNDGG